MPRGGSRNLGMRLRNNTSGLCGIRFAWRPSKLADASPWPYVCASWIDGRGKARRNSYSVERNGRQGALERAIARRRKAGYPVPSIQEAMFALSRFMRRRKV